ncbi:polysaccharide biosynthesis/export family protein [Parasphingorhabdus halotolerans]|uniref:Polysaccharide export protein n=1 Tax=Parasphingorhabdus halotolerans TaxID=2725558 RepID=A0A6H2DPS8_9SPHN|nr:polysaccharide biosynthesis/export family protein [Parasphingorhabdus halotolerans]QJB69761.1 polysaccharide export protein [Parasphingorhabdus halotolerans]
MKLFSPIFVCIFLLTGCAGNGRMGLDKDIQLSSQVSLPPPNRGDVLANNRAYLIGPFDKLGIDVFGIEDLSRKVQIDASGRLSFPLIGVVEAAGLTPDELADHLETQLADRFVKNPQITVNLEDTVSQVITVDGQVNKPGLYPVVGRMTLMRAVATAGGTSEFAQLKNVVVFRTVNGQQMAGLFDLKAIRKGNYSDPEVFANDVIMVGDSQARRLFKDILQASPLLTTPLIILFQN